MPENAHGTGRGETRDASDGPGDEEASTAASRDPDTERIERENESLPEDEEPVTTGTVFLTLIFLMMIFGFWMMMYLILLER